VKKERDDDEGVKKEKDDDENVKKEKTMMRMQRKKR